MQTGNDLAPLQRRHNFLPDLPYKTVDIDLAIIIFHLAALYSRHVKQRIDEPGQPVDLCVEPCKHTRRSFVIRFRELLLQDLSISLYTGYGSL